LPKVAIAEVSPSARTEGTLQVIANPNAAGGKGASLIPRLEDMLRAEGIEFALHRTEASGHGRELARTREIRQAERLVVLGGDGTIHEVVNGLLDEVAIAASGNSTPVLAVLPMGTGNDFHRMLRVSGSAEALMEILRTGVPRPFDVGRVEWEGGRGHFVNLLGIGIDVEVLRRRPAFGRFPGLLQYLLALGSALAGFQAVPLRLTWVDGQGESETVETSALISAVTVGPSIGGGFLVSPGATPDDGLLDLFLVEALGVGKVLRYLPGVLAGSLESKPEIHQARLTSLRITAADESPFQFELDGELMEQRTSCLDIRVLPGRLNILDTPDVKSKPDS